MKIAIHVTETDWEGKMSQNFDIGLSLCFTLCRKVDFQKKIQNYKKVACLFALKMKLGPK